MGRTEARIKTSIWVNEDFKSLDRNSQYAYFLAISQPNLSLCGVVPYTPKRWASFAVGLTPDEIATAFENLESKGFVVIDDSTEELMIRTFVKHDGVLDKPNVLVSMTRDWGNVLSPTIRNAVLDALGEGFLKGLPEGFHERLAEPFLKGFHERFREGLPEPLVDDSDNPSGKGSANPSGKGSNDDVETVPQTLPETVLAHTHTRATHAEPPPPPPPPPPKPLRPESPDGSLVTVLDHAESPTLRSGSLAVARAPDLLWNALLEACGIEAGAKLSKSTRGAYNAALKGLREREVVPEQVFVVARAYRALWPKAALTPTALDRRWDEVIANVSHKLQPDKPEDDLEFQRFLAMQAAQ